MVTLSMHVYVIYIVMNIICVICVIYLSIVKIWRRKRGKGISSKLCVQTLALEYQVWAHMAAQATPGRGYWTLDSRPLIRPQPTG